MFLSSDLILVSIWVSIWIDCCNISYDGPISAGLLTIFGLLVELEIGNCFIGFDGPNKSLDIVLIDF